MKQNMTETQDEKDIFEINNLIERMSIQPCAYVNKNIELYNKLIKYLEICMFKLFSRKSAFMNKEVHLNTRNVHLK